MSSLSAEERDLSRSTTPILSDLKQTRLCDQYRPRYYNRNKLLCCDMNRVPILRPAYHPCRSVYAPQPNVSDASERISTDVVDTGKKDIPFQPCRKVCHQMRSALAPAFRRIKWCGTLSRERSVNSSRRNTRPCEITVAACDR